MTRHPLLRASFACLLVFGLAWTGAGQDKDKPDKPEPPKKQVVGDKLPPNAAKLFSWRSIGPANMGGRITGIAVFEADPTCCWIATASGGLLKTTNNGSTFEHQFDREATVSIGAIAVAQTNRNIVWVGTGEANPRNSVSYGDGVYKSTDGGKSWKNMGLKQSYQIGKIVIHPKNPDIVYVGVLGRLYGPSEERGIYKTTDGGKTWERVLFIDNVTGVLEIVMSPADPEMLLAATWERQRDEFDSFLGSAKPPKAADVYAPSKVHAPGTKIHRSTDGGKTWHVVTEGLPKAKLGRIGLDWHRKNPKLVFAVIDTEKAGMGNPPSPVFLGVSSEGTPKGLQIKELVKDAPAQKAGLEKGDLLLKLDGKDLKNPAQLVALLQTHKPDDKVKVVYQRGDEKKEVEVTLGRRPPEDAPPGAPKVALGADIEEAEDDGVVITDLVEGGAAEKAGLKIGDEIVALDDVKMATNARAQIFKLLQTKNVGDKLKVTIQRGKEKKDINVTLEPRTSGTPGRPYGGRLAGQAANVQDQQGPDGVNTGGIFKSTDAGVTWTRVNSLNERPFYFSVIRVDPNDEKILFATGVNLWRSTDGGKKFEPKDINTGLHSDQHDLWINPKDGRHLIIATDGGFYVSYDRAAHWEHLNNFALGQFYHVAVDARRPYYAFGGLQDNGSWGIPSQTLRPSGPSNPDALLVNGGDGFVCRVDPSDPNTVYAESQDGKLMRRNLQTGATKGISPKLQGGAAKYRWNWNTPFILSAHNPKIYYCAANYVFRSVQQGDNLRMISREITRTKRGSATALAESPKNADVLWVGTDDGAVWLTRDGGKNWTNLSENFKLAGLPGPRWVTTIEPSHESAGRCYVVFDAHRSNDDEPYVFVTDDYGQSWKSLRANLPMGSTRCLREDIVNPNLLYLGTEFAAWASLDRGQHWFKLNGDKLPTVAIHEFAQPTTAPELVAATHGRSLWVLDVTTLRQLKSDLAKDKAQLFAPAKVTTWSLDTMHEGMFKTGTRAFVGQNPPRAAELDFLLPKKAEKLELKVVDIQGKTVRKFDMAKANEPGLHRIGWDLSGDPQPGGKKGGMGMGPKGKVKGQPGKGPKDQSGGGPPMKPGTYRVVLTADDQESSQTLVIEPDPRNRGGENAADEAAEDRRLRRLVP